MPDRGNRGSSGPRGELGTGNWKQVPSRQSHRHAALRGSVHIQTWSRSGTARLSR